MRLWALGLLGLVCACRAERSELSSDSKIRIVATTSIVADLVTQVGGDHVHVDALMGPGVDPHLFKASARDVSILAAADVVVYNGLHLEGKMGDLFKEMQGRGTPTIAVAELGVPDSLLRASELFQGNYDPHVWFDVALWKLCARSLALELARLDSVHTYAYLDRGARYAEQLQQVEEYVHEKVSQLPEEQRILVTSHDAFGYFGRAYGFDVRGLQGISTAAEAGTADVQSLAELVASRQIPAMFIESSVSPRGIEAVREAVRARGFEVRIGGTLYGDALGAPNSMAATYGSMVRHNVDTIVDALANDIRN